MWKVNFYDEQGSVVNGLSGLHVDPSAARARQCEDGSMSVRVDLIVIDSRCLVIISYLSECIKEKEGTDFMSWAAKK